MLTSTQGKKGGSKLSFLPDGGDAEGEAAAFEAEDDDGLSTIMVKNTIKFFSEAYSWTALLWHTQSCGELLEALCSQSDNDPSNSHQRPRVVESGCKVQMVCPDFLFIFFFFEAGKGLDKKKEKQLYQLTCLMNN